MPNFTIEIQASDRLIAVLENLTAALSGTTAPTQTPPVPIALPITPSPTVNPAMPAPVAPNHAPAPVQVAPPAPAPVQTAPVVQQPPVNAATPVVSAAPVAAPPTYQRDDLARAAAQLMDANKQQELMALLAQYNAPSLVQLPQEQFGNFATALRQMGAKI